MPTTGFATPMQRLRHLAPVLVLPSYTIGLLPSEGWGMDNGMVRWMELGIPYIAKAKK